MKRIWTVLLCFTIVLSVAGCDLSPTNIATPPDGVSSTATTTMPVIGPTCPPVSNDQHWAAFQAKRYIKSESDYPWIQSITLYCDGVCTYEANYLSSSFPSPTVWSFDGEYLYIGSVESNVYATFQYIPADGLSDSTLVFKKTGCENRFFERLHDGQVFFFSGIIPWETEIPPTSSSSQP